MQPPDSDPEQDDVKPGWSAEIVAEFEKGARVGMVDVSLTAVAQTSERPSGRRYPVEGGAHADAFSGTPRARL